MIVAAEDKRDMADGLNQLGITFLANCFDRCLPLLPSTTLDADFYQFMIGKRSLYLFADIIGESTLCDGDHGFESMANAAQLFGIVGFTWKGIRHEAPLGHWLV